MPAVLRERINFCGREITSAAGKLSFSLLLSSFLSPSLSLCFTYLIWISSQNANEENYQTNRLRIAEFVETQRILPELGQSRKRSSGRTTLSSRARERPATFSVRSHKLEIYIIISKVRRYCTVSGRIASVRPTRFLTWFYLHVMNWWRYKRNACKKFWICFLETSLSINFNFRKISIFRNPIKISIYSMYEI